MGALAWTCSNVAGLDGTVVRTHRIRGHDRRYYSDQHKHHGVTLPGLTDLDGRLICEVFSVAGGVQLERSCVQTAGGRRV